MKYNVLVMQPEDSSLWNYTGVMSVKWHFNNSGRERCQTCNAKSVNWAEIWLL